MALTMLLSLSLLLPSVLTTPIQIQSPLVTLPMVVKINSTGGAQALVNRDRARARALFANGLAKAKGKSLAHVPASDAVATCIASVGVGAGTYSLIVDTGSSNTWIGADRSYQPGPSSQDTGATVSVSYGSGSFSGKEFIDNVKLGSATISGQSFGVASSVQGIGFDGILGIGPVDLTAGTLSNGDVIPTVTDNLFSQGTIPATLVGVSFAPTIPADEPTGELDFGAIDSNKFTGPMSIVPITSTIPANNYWGIDQSITYGFRGTTILGTTAGIVDTGTTLILLATDAFQAYQQETGATLDQHTGLLTVTSESNLQSLFFNVGDATFELTPNAQIWPRQFNWHIDGQPDQIYLVVSDIGSPSGVGLDFINGFTFLQRFYSVFDTDNAQVGLAATSHTYDTTN